MSKSAFESLLKDSKVMDQVARLLSEGDGTELRQLQGGLRPKRRGGLEIAGDEAPLLGLEVSLRKFVDGDAVKKSVMNSELPAPYRSGLEAIVLLTGRPALLIQDGTYQDPPLDELGRRLKGARKALKAVIPSVGRLEFENYGALNYAGTAWMVEEKVMVTNRHVAKVFAENAGKSIRFKANENGHPIRARVNCKREHQRSDEKSISLPIKRVLYIEPEGNFRPDMAFLEVERNGDLLPKRIELFDGEVAMDDDVATVGYPAFDSRNGTVEMYRIFDGVFNVKRLSPGRVMDPPAGRVTFAHDCSTLGGNSGSLVFGLEVKKAVGLHFSGGYLQSNFAVSSAAVLRRLRRLRTMVGYMPDSSPNGTDAAAETDELPQPTADALASRKGYDKGFLGINVPPPVPKRIPSGAVAPVTGNKQGLLHYAHFSLSMHKERRLALFTACNIDGSQFVKVKRTPDRWYFDPRIDRKFQAGPDLYIRNSLDRGHLVRRLDPAWGKTEVEILEAIGDTFFFTNCTPQHAEMNEKTWLSLEDYILGNADAYGMKVNVFTGPVLRKSDRPYRGFQLPSEYWKVAVIRKGRSRNLSATGYLVSQANLIEDLEFAFGGFRTYQVAIKALEDRTGLDFGELKDSDPLGRIETAPNIIINGPGDLVI